MITPTVLLSFLYLLFDSDSDFSRKCTICLTDLDSAKFEKSEISELCEAVTSRILYKGDVYQTSNPLEIERFEV